MTDVRSLVPADWPDVERIYRQGIDEGDATFETHPPTWEEFTTSKLPTPRLVAADDGGRVRGWVAASQVSSREAYRGVIEHSVYVDRDYRGQGMGRTLLAAFITGAESAGYWTIQSSIFPENSASLQLHVAAGFRVVGRRERIARSRLGAQAGQWRDTLLIERRSTAES
ncbi:GNAT family N-acetyltransferase [Microbacterium sp. MTN4-26]|uniref:GNAT family N-acetyltransferase n=1 Tax=unclassified Microbacterium TaxID=2609290 RepID=UPI0036F23781